MKTLLVCVDFSEVTDRLLAQAEKIAGAFHEKVFLLHVAEPEPDFVGYEVGPDVVVRQSAEVLERRTEQLNELAALLRNAHPDVPVEAVVEPGATAMTVLDKADEVGADMILLGTHGHGRLYHLLVGSVAEAVMRKAKCPVLLVPTERQEP